MIHLVCTAVARNFCHAFANEILASDRQILKTAEELRAAVIDLLDRLNGEGVVYAELRLCPALHTLEGLTEQQVGEILKVGANICCPIIRW